MARSVLRTRSAELVAVFGRPAIADASSNTHIVRMTQRALRSWLGHGA